MNYDALSLGVAAGITAGAVNFATRAFIEYRRLCDDAEQLIQAGESRQDVYRIFGIIMKHSPAFEKPIVRLVRRKYATK